MTGRRWLRLSAKALHELASIAFGGGLAACLVIDMVAVHASPEAFATGRHLFAAIAKDVLVPSMIVVATSGLIALAATRAYMDAGWAWLKALLGLSLFEATLLVMGSSQKQAEIMATTDPALVAAVLRSERNTLWFLIALSAANVVLAVWRPRLAIKVR